MDTVKQKMNLKDVKILLLIIFIFSFGAMAQSWRTDDLEERIVVLENELNTSKEKYEMLRQDFLHAQYQFESFRDLTSEEFEKTWVSFRNIRDNFRTIGYTLKFGSHLDKKDKENKNKRKSPVKKN